MAKIDLLELASSVADGCTVEWDAVERRAATDEERRVVRNLRLVSRLSDAGAFAEESPLPHAELDRMTSTVRSLLAMNAEAGTDGRTEGDLPIPRGWGGLELRGRLGEGAFGEVYLAWDPGLEREVALKLLKRGTSGRLGERVLGEGRLLARVRHPNVVTVHGAEQHDGRVGLWMELVRGRSLDEVLRETGRLGAREASVIGIDICRALAAVHGAGLVHRDVKAGNVMREEGGRILLMDFGAGREEAAAEEDEISGTPLYIAPEVYEGRPATARSDLYSLGVLLFHLVTGTYPIEARTLNELRVRHTRRESRLLRDVRPDLPEPFVRVVERALAWDPEDRFTTAGQLEQALAAALGMEPTPGALPAAHRRPLRSRGAFWLAGAAAIVALLTIGVALRHKYPGPDGEPGPGIPAAGNGGAMSGMGTGPVGAPPGPAALTELPPPGTTSGAGDRVGPPARAHTADGSGTDPDRGAGMDLTKPSTGDHAVSGGPASYSVRAELQRMGPGGATERLESGSRVTIGDRLSLEFFASSPVYLYIIDEDDRGNAFVLFPLPGLDLENPLPIGTHDIPGSMNGRQQYWVTDTIGGRERLLLLASPDRLVEFEAELSRLPRPQPGTLARQLPQESLGHLRGIGGLVEGPSRNSDTLTPARHLFEMAEDLAASSRSVQGSWVRRIELENPPTEDPR